MTNFHTVDDCGVEVETVVFAQSAVQSIYMVPAGVDTTTTRTVHN